MCRLHGRSLEKTILLSNVHSHLFGIFGHISCNHFECNHGKRDKNESKTLCIFFLFTFFLSLSLNRYIFLKEYLKLIGVKSHVICVCWMIRSLSVYLCLSLLFTLVGKYKFKYKIESSSTKSLGLLFSPLNTTTTTNHAIKENDDDWHEKALFLNTSSFVLILTLFVYSMQLSCLSILVGQIFTKGLFIFV